MQPFVDADGGSLPGTTVDESGRVILTAIRVPDGLITIGERGNEWWWSELDWEDRARCRHEPGAEMWALSDESRGWYFGKDDCSVTLHFAHDTDYLYIRAEVRDQVLFNTADPETPNLGDDIELFIDANGPDKRFAETNNENVRQIMLVAGDINPAWREPHIWQSDKTAEKPRAASRLTPHGYTMEIAIPKASFPHWKENPDMDSIGFDGFLVDADAPGVDIHHPALKGAHCFCTYAQHFLKPAHLSLLVLEKEPVSIPHSHWRALPGPTWESGPSTKFIPGADLAHSHTSPLPPSPGAEVWAQKVLDLIDDPQADLIAADAIKSRSHLIAKAGMLVLARRPNLPLPEAMMEETKRLAARKDPEAVAAVLYAMEALAVRKQFPVADMFAITKPSTDPAVWLTFMYYSGLNGDKAATPILLNILKNDPNFRLRMMAALALGMLQDPTALDALQEATSDKDGDVRLQAADAIKKIEAAK